MNVTAKPDGRRGFVPSLASRTLPRKPDAGERWGSLLFALGGVAITLSLIGAIWATNHGRVENHTLTSSVDQAEQAMERVVISAPGSLAHREDVPKNGLVGGVPHAVATQVAIDPLSWSELTLMLRTGLTDDEVIAAIAGKQLTVVMDSEAARALRARGAGNRLIGYLQGLTVYRLPLSAPAQVASAPPQVYSPQVNNVPVATPYPVVDYAARDRKVASLKKQIDALDEQIRVARSHPNDYLWPGVYYRHSGDGTSRQQAADEYIKGLEDQRDDLRRQKWQLEGR